MFRNMTRLEAAGQRRFWHACTAAFLAVGIIAFTARAESPPAIVGDINGDGKIDVLDIQSATNIALATAADTPQADVDLNSTVNVLDVQVLTNTALGAGGLVQPVAGTYTTAKSAKQTGSIKLVAISTDGRKVETEVDPSTGNFALELAIRTNWSLAFVDTTGDATTVGTISFPVAGKVVSSLPLPSLSNGTVLQIGEITAGIGTSTSEDLRTLLAEVGEPLKVEDSQTSGLPAVFQGLLLPYPWSVAGSGIKLPASLDEAVLEAKLRECLLNSVDNISQPDLTGIEVGGVPAFVVPVLTCFSVELTNWIKEGSNLNSIQVAALVVQILAAVQPRIRPWLDSLDRVELTDTNNNGIPDYIEGDLCQEQSAGGKGTTGDCELDTDTNGIPDFAEDSNQNGTPNYLDPENHTELDSDGDGIPNATDLDDDNDGLLDYADTAPLDPTKS